MLARTARAARAQVCSVSVGVVGDLCRALEGGILPYCDEIVTLLMQNLQARAHARTRAHTHAAWRAARRARSRDRAAARARVSRARSRSR